MAGRSPCDLEKKLDPLTSVHWAGPHTQGTASMEGVRGRLERRFV